MKNLLITFSILTTFALRSQTGWDLQQCISYALKHNITDRDKPLKIEIFTMGDYLIVSNNLQLRKLVDTSNKQGLENLKSLYSFLTDIKIKGY